MTPRKATSRVYCFDTSSFIGGWVEHYPPDAFPSFWERIDDLMDQGSVTAPEDVRAELRHPSELQAWAAGHDESFRELDDELQESLRAVVADLREHMRGQRLKLRPTDLGPDLVVVAMARITDADVVSEENPRGPQGRPKIPDLCGWYEIRCIRLVDFIREQEMQF